MLRHPYERWAIASTPTTNGHSLFPRVNSKKKKSGAVVVLRTGAMEPNPSGDLEHGCSNRVFPRQQKHGPSFFFLFFCGSRWTTRHTQAATGKKRIYALLQPATSHACVELKQGRNVCSASLRQQRYASRQKRNLNIFLTTKNSARDFGCTGQPMHPSMYTTSNEPSMLHIRVTIL